MSRRSHSDRIIVESVGNIIQFEWGIPNTTNLMKSLKITGCNNGDHYIAKESTNEGVIIRPFKLSPNNRTNLHESSIQVLINHDQGCIDCWDPIRSDGTLPVSAFRVAAGSRNIYVGKRLDVGVGQVERRNKKWIFISEDNHEFDSEFRVLCALSDN